MKRHIFAAILFGSLMASAHATTLVRVGFNDQASGADLVVLGKALRIEETGRRGFPFQRVIIEVSEVIAGEYSGGEVAVLQPGGIGRDGRRMRVGGVRYIKPGDEVLLFLRSDPQGGYRIIGLNQGQYSISRENGTGRKIITISDHTGRKKSMTLDGARRRVHAVRANSANANKKNPGAGQ